MRYSLLCSGSKGNCFVLQDENTCIVIDCGSTKRYLSGALSEIGVSVSDVDALLITHTHTDHISQIKMFRDIPTYAWCEIPGVDRVPLEPLKKFQIEHLTVTPLAMSHDADNTCGFVIESWQEKLVYITDTGYVKDAYLDLLKDADYIVLESNHDVEMLMHTSRPQYVKMRIASDMGHLCNEDCAAILDTIVSKKTKSIILAHISQQGNTQEKALAVNHDVLVAHHGNLNPELTLTAAGQFEIIQGGTQTDEKIGNPRVSCALGMERLADVPSR